MSDVRDELIEAIQGERERWTDGRCVSSVEIAAAILERFEVTPKAVISDEELGRMVERSWAVGGDPPAWKGQRMLAFLRMDGLQIVRKEAGE